MQIKENIKAAITCAILPIAPAIILYRFSHYIKYSIYIIIFFWLISSLCIIFPKAGMILHRIGSSICKFLEKYITIIALFIVYIFAVIPTGFLMKLVKRDRLNLKKSNLDTYWKNNENQNTDYEYQF